MIMKLLEEAKANPPTLLGTTTSRTSSPGRSPDPSSERSPKTSPKTKSSSRVAKGTPNSSARGSSTNGRGGGSPTHTHQAIARVKLRLRAGCELDSEEIGSVPSSTIVNVLELGRDLDGTHRAHVQVCAATGEVLGKPGWVSTFGKDGRFNLIPLSSPDSTGTGTLHQVAQAGSKRQRTSGRHSPALESDQTKQPSAGRLPSPSLPPPPPRKGSTPKAKRPPPLGTAALRAMTPGAAAAAAERYFDVLTQQLFGSNDGGDIDGGSGHATEHGANTPSTRVAVALATLAQLCDVESDPADGVVDDAAPPCIVRASGEIVWFPALVGGVVSALTRHAADENVQAASLYLIARLTNCDAAKQGALEAGALDAVAAALDTHGVSSRSVQQCGALAVLQLTLPGLAHRATSQDAVRVQRAIETGILRALSSILATDPAAIKASTANATVGAGGPETIAIPPANAQLPPLRVRLCAAAKAWLEYVAENYLTPTPARTPGAFAAEAPPKQGGMVYVDAGALVEVGVDEEGNLVAFTQIDEDGGESLQSDAVVVAGSAGGSTANQYESPIASLVREVTRCLW